MKKVLYQVLTWIVETKLSFATVDSKSFAKFDAILDPPLSIPSRRNVQRQVLD